MTITEFLTAHASKGYTSIDELWGACDPGFLREGEGKAEFLKLLARYMRKYRGGYMPNGKVFYTELPISTRKNQLVVRTRKGNVALILVANLM